MTTETNDQQLTTMFGCLYLPPLAGQPALDFAPSASRGADSRTFGLSVHSDLASLAREFSPRVEVHGPGLVTLDARGLDRLFGDAGTLGQELRRAAADRRLPVRVALASTRPAAWLAAHARAGLTIVPAGEEARWLSPLPLHLLEQLAANGLGPTPAAVASLLAILKRWGLRTLGEFAVLPPLDLSERLGQHGLAWQRLARGEEMALLVPCEPDERFEETLDLEWPIEGLQPLSFVLARLFDQLSARLEVRDRAVAVLHLHLQLVTREVERRALQLPAPVRDSRVLRTLALLHLEANPVSAGIDRVTVIADPVPGRIVQCSLLTRALPMPEQLATLIGRLGAVVGDRRCGMAALVDSHRPGAFVMQPFPAAVAAGPRTSPGLTGTPTRLPRRGARPPQPTADSWQRTTLRRVRIPIPASVVLKDGCPARVSTNRPGLRGGQVDACAGPWRTSGEWWRVSDARVQADGEYSRAEVGWNRDEWDVNLADGTVCRIYRDRDRDRWFVDGVID